jgi:hypothetical protein
VLQLYLKICKLLLKKRLIAEDYGEYILSRSNYMGAD